jgi:archaellum component FlaF (FlaF/FlaG flagellin family)
MRKSFALICLIIPVFFFITAIGFCDDAKIFDNVKIEHFKVSTDADGKWNYSVKVTNTGKKFCNNVFYIKIFKNDELWEELTLSKLLQGSTGGAYQTSNSSTMEKLFKNHVKTNDFKCILLLEDTSVEEAKSKSEFKTVHIENYKNKIVVDSFKTDEKTYTAVLKNNSKYIIDVGLVALELCNGQMIYKESSFTILRPDKTTTVTKQRGSKADGCTGVLLKLIDHNAETGKDLLFSKTFQYQQ